MALAARALYRRTAAAHFGVRGRRALRHRMCCDVTSKSVSSSSDNTQKGQNEGRIIRVGKLAFWKIQTRRQSQRPSDDNVTVEGHQLGQGCLSRSQLPSSLNEAIDQSRPPLTIRPFFTFSLNTMKTIFFKDFPFFTQGTSRVSSGEDEEVNSGAV